MTRATMVAWVGLAALLAGCGGGKSAAPAGGKRAGMRQAAFPVEVMKVEEKPHEVVISSPGSIDAFEVIQITARVAGVVDKVTFIEGQEIKKGQVLAFIDSRRYALNVSAAKAAVAKADATAGDVEQALKRRENAVKNNPGLIPGEELETYQTKLRTAKADAQQAREALKLAELNLTDSNVRSPAEGIIQTRSVATGQMVQQGTAIATVLRRDPMLLRFHVTTGEAPRLKIGMPVEFTLKESLRTYTAKITLIAAAAEAESRLVPITGEVQSDKKFWLRPGSFALVKVKLTPQRQFPLIPVTAARPSDRGFLAYVVDKDAVHERVLQMGLHTADGWVEVKDGLKAGETLVTKGHEALADGTKIRVVEPGAPASQRAGAGGERPDGAKGAGGGRAGGGGKAGGGRPGGGKAGGGKAGGAEAGGKAP
jgi:membrane fusion protein, multidrug efflux system